MRSIHAALVTVALLAVPSVSRGQDGPPGPPPLPPPLSEILKEPLGLTDDQVEKVRGFEDEMHATLEKARAAAEQDGGPPDFEKMHEAFEAARTTVESKVRAILTKEQAAKLDGVEKDLEERRGAMDGPDGPRHGPPTEKDFLAKVEGQLSLGAEEKAKVLALVKTFLDAKRSGREADRRRRSDLAKLLQEIPGTTDAQKSEIGEKLTAFRDASARDAASVSAAEAALRGAVAAPTEAQLVVAGVLD